VFRWLLVAVPVPVSRTHASKQAHDHVSVSVRARVVAARACAISARLCAPDVNDHQIVALLRPRPVDQLSQRSCTHAPTKSAERATLRARARTSKHARLCTGSLASAAASDQSLRLAAADVHAVGEGLLGRQRPQQVVLYALRHQHRVPPLLLLHRRLSACSVLARPLVVPTQNKRGRGGQRRPKASRGHVR
jgi:hypothetical protein